MEIEKTVVTRPPRSFMRRFAAPLVLSTAVLGGGGTGAYYFLGGSSVEQDSATSADAHSAHTAKDELKNLFSTDVADTSPDKATDEQTAKPSFSDAKSDRYTLAAEDSALPPFASTQPPSSDNGSPSSDNSPTTVVGDRYAAALSVPPSTSEQDYASSTVEEDDSDNVSMEASDEPPSSEAINADVARGQEPDVNPLRSAEPSPDSATNDVDAQAAFGDSPQSEQEAPIPIDSRTPVDPSEQVSAAFDQAQPLPPKSGATLESNRYQAAEPTLAEPPPVDFGSAGTVTETGQPAPAFDMEQPLAVQRGSTPPSNVTLGGQASAGFSDITPTPGLTNKPGTGRPGEQLLEGAQSPSITIQKLAPTEIQVGKRCTFAIRIQNTGQRTAQNVQIHDEVPLGTELVGTAPRAAVSGSHVVWDMGTLSVGEERTVEMELMPVEEGELGSVATVTMAAQASAKARCTKPELALRLSCKPQVLMGQQHVVQIEISNPGSGVATGVMLLENLPPGVSHQAGPALEFEVGTLQPGDSRRMELVLTAEQAGKINNIMTARADANLRIKASCEFEIIAPELKLSIDGPQRRYLERPATYQVSIDNPGTATAQEVQLVTHLPKGLQFVSANNMGEYNSSTHSVQWSLAELPANERGTVELVALPIEAGEQTLQAATKARQGLEDRIEKQVLVEGLSALTFEVTDVEGLIEIGGETIYEILVANQGSKAAVNVQVVVVLEPGLRAISGQGETQHTIQNDRVIFAPVAQLAPKAETAFRVTAQGASPGDQRVRVMVKSNDLEQPITKEVSTRVYADE